MIPGTTRGVRKNLADWGWCSITNVKAEATRATRNEKKGGVFSCEAQEEELGSGAAGLVCKIWGKQKTGQGAQKGVQQNEEDILASMLAK